MHVLVGTGKHHDATEAGRRGEWHVIWMHIMLRWFGTDQAAKPEPVHVQTTLRVVAMECCEEKSWELVPGRVDNVSEGG